MLVAVEDEEEDEVVPGGRGGRLDVLPIADTPAPALVALCRRDMASPSDNEVVEREVDREGDSRLLSRIYVSKLCMLLRFADGLVLLFAADAASPEFEWWRCKRQF